MGRWEQRPSKDSPMSMPRKKSHDLYDKCPICEATCYDSRIEGTLKPCPVCGGEKYTAYGLNHSQVQMFIRQRDAAQQEVTHLKSLLKRWMTYQEMEEVVETEGFIQLYNDSCAALELEQGARLVEHKEQAAPKSVLSPELLQLADEIWERDKTGLQYLADEDKRSEDKPDA